MTITQNATATTSTIDNGRAIMLTQDVTATVKGQKNRQKVGEFSVYMPFITRFADIIASAKQTGTDEEGVPVYDTDGANWLQRAILALSKAEARNKLLSGSADVKPGLKIPTSFDELVTPAEGSGSNALAAIADLIKGFTSWLESTGKPAAIIPTMGQLVRNKSAIGLQSEKVRTVLSSWLQEYGATATGAGALTEYQQNYLVSLIEACTEVQSLDDMLDGF